MDDRLTQALSELPREPASADFTAGVMRRLEQAEPHHRSGFLQALFGRPLVASLAGLIVLAMVFGARHGWLAWQHDQTVARLAEIEAEKQAIEQEISSLRRQTASARPVVLLGSTPEVDLVFDLASFRHSRFAPRRPGGDSEQRVRPARLERSSSSPIIY